MREFIRRFENFVFIKQISAEVKKIFPVTHLNNHLMISINVVFITKPCNVVHKDNVQLLLLDCD